MRSTQDYSKGYHLGQRLIELRSRYGQGSILLFRWASWLNQTKRDISASFYNAYAWLGKWFLFQTFEDENKKDSDMKQSIREVHQILNEDESEGVQ